MTGLGAALLAVALGVAPPSPAEEVRGLWVVRTALVSPEEADRVVDQARAAGFNTLLVQVRGRGDAFYLSRLVPRSPLLAGQPAAFDPLARVLSRARAAGLRVHAWVNVLLAAGFGQALPPGHVLLDHPEWAMVPRPAAAAALRARGPERLRLFGRETSDPDVEGFYLSPAAPGVASHLTGVVEELLSAYDVDGLHLDFARYPGPEYDYSPEMVAAFRARGGEDPLGGNGRFAEAWARFRRQALSDLVARLSLAAHRTRRGVTVSAAVVSDQARAVEHKYQDWPGWVAAGLLDVVCPMAYAPEEPLFRSDVAGAVARAAGRRVPVWAGVGAYRLGVRETIARIRLARSEGARGVVLFSHESLGPEDARRLREEAFGGGAR